MKDIVGLEPSNAKNGTLVLVFGKTVWEADKDLIAALQGENVIAPFAYAPRALNTKVLAFPWIVPATSDEVEAQHAAISAHAQIVEARAFAIPELANFFLDGDDKPAPYLDGGELTIAMARANPTRIADAIPYLRAPQRADWFMDALAAVAEETKAPGARALVYDAIAQMPVPPSSNKHHKTYVRALAEGATAFRAANDAGNAKRLEQKAMLFGKQRTK